MDAITVWNGITVFAGLALVGTVVAVVAWLRRQRS